MCQPVGAWNLGDLKIEFEELIVEQTPIEILGFSAPEIDQIRLGDDPPPHEQEHLRPRLELSQSHEKATSSVLANIESFVPTPPLSRLSCETMAQPGWS